MPTKAPPVDLYRSIRGRILLTFVLSVIVACASIVPFIAIIDLARTLLPAVNDAHVDSERAWLAVIVAVVSLVVRFIAFMAAGNISHQADNDMQLDLRKRIVEHLSELPLGWFGKRTSGVVKKSVENHVSALHQLVAHAITELTTALTLPLLSLIYLFTVDWRMALAALVPAILTISFFPLMMKDARERYLEYDAATEDLSAATIEFVQGISVVKTFGQAGLSHGRYQEETKRFGHFYGDWMRQSALGTLLIEIVTAPVVILTYLCGVSAWLVSTGRIAPVDTLPALILGLGLTAPLLQLGFSSQAIRTANQAKQSLEELLSVPHIAYSDTPSLPQNNAVDFTDLTFSYDAEHNVLENIAANCPPGTITALVGPSGSGKTTLARLIPRFYDVDSGALSIGNVDVRDIAKSELYGEVGFVFQDPYLLRTTVRDNIRLTDPNASQEKVEQAARTAQIHERILELPRGYDSVIGEDANLSGGEQQRLAIARGIIADAPILVLDEATAFTDPDSEASIQEALSHLAVGRTVIVIAHRLHTITGVDQILVLDEGRIVEKGKHSDLIDADGLYQSLWNSYEAARKKVDQ